MKKILGVLLAITLIITGYGCNKNSNSKEVRINVLSGDTKLSYEGTTYTAIDGVTYQNGDLLPVWRELSDVLSIDIVDSDVSENKRNNNLVIDSLSNLQTSRLDGELIDLSDYLASGKLNNFSKFLNDNKDIAKSITTSTGEIYFAPSSVQTVTTDQKFMIRADWVKMLLDTQYDSEGNVMTASYDTDKILPSQGGYTNFLELLEDEDGNITSVDITVSTSTGNKTFTKNTLASSLLRQNALATNDKTGAKLVNAFKIMLTMIYKDAFDKGIYTNLSDIFLSESAAYTAEDLIGLMRCVVTNPKYLTGNSSQTSVTGFFTTDGSIDGQEDMLALAQIFGYRGFASQNEFLYIDSNNDLNDIRSDADTIYNAIARLGQMYNEGLLLTNYVTDRDWQYELINTGFLTYGDNASVSGLNSNFEAILPPMALWSGDGIDLYSHFSESYSIMGDYAWAITTISTDEEIDNALKLIDYLYSDAGSKLMSYGPSAWTDGETTVNGVTVPKVNQTVIDIISNTKDVSGNTITSTDVKKTQDYLYYYQNYVGALAGVGYVKSSGLTAQILNTSGKAGETKFTNAINNKVLKTVTLTGEGFYRMVPSTFTFSSIQQTSINRNTVISDLISISSLPNLIRNGISGNFTKKEELNISPTDGSVISKASYRNNIEGDFTIYMRSFKELWKELNKEGE